MFQPIVITDSVNAAPTINPGDWVMDWGDGSWPFVEDENANITGLGHQDPAEFAAAVNRYDAHCNGQPFPEDEQWDVGYIAHRWAIPRDENGDIYLRAVPEGTPGAIAITTLWGQR